MTKPNYQIKSAELEVPAVIQLVFWLFVINQSVEFAGHVLWVFR